MASISVHSDIEKLHKPFEQLANLGADPAPILQKIADYGERSTRLRFRKEEAPDGSRWKESIRKRVLGGKTLTKSGLLGSSISSLVDGNQAMWGTNLEYAAIHQLGGVIEPKNKPALAFGMAGGGFAVVKKVTMPARPFLGINQRDANGMLKFLNKQLKEALGAR
jgi:phage virion morphogenesis protein